MYDFPIIDAHLHVWDTNEFRYPWLDDIPQLNTPYLLDDYKRATQSFNIEQMVFVQCEAEFDQYLKETKWITKLSKGNPGISGIVSWAPLEKGENSRQELEILASNPLVKGIRRIIQYENDLDFCIQPDFIRGVQILEDFNFSFDICISHIHFKNTLRLVEQCPGVNFILDHIGKPDIKDQVLHPWMEDIKKLAEFPNVYCKMSGLVTEADHQNWHKEDLQPFFDHVIDCFGFDRLVFGGDWPVVGLASPFQGWVETLLSLLNGVSEFEKQKLFYRNAQVFYKL
jgi:L-fuconolactonase